MGIFPRLFPFKSQSGFSIVEITVVLPVATIITVSLISILFTQYGSILAESRRSNLRTNGQAILTNLQDELLFTVEYGHGLNDDLSDANAPSGGWTHDTTPQTLIVSETALDGARADTDRNVIRQRTVDCSANSINSNPVAVNNIIYFVEDNADNNFKKLKKRTVIPTYDYCSIDRVSGNPCDPTTATCLPNIKQTSCQDSNIGSGGCTKADSLLSDRVVDFQVKYFSVDNVETTYPSAAEKLQLTLTLGDRIYGRDVVVDVEHTIRKIN